MKNVDVEIYLSQFMSFFEKNPSSLDELIGNLNKDDFFNKVEQQCYSNLENGEEVSLTKTQIVQIIADLFNGEKKETISNKIESVFQKTKIGDICLN